MLSAGSCNTDEWREGNGGWRDGSGGCRDRGDSAEKSMGVRDNIEKERGQRKDDHKLLAKEQEVVNGEKIDEIKIAPSAGALPS